MLSNGDGVHALRALKAGNERFVTGVMGGGANEKCRAILPGVAVLCCADMPCPIQRIFDVESDDIFVIQKAAHLSKDAEYQLALVTGFCLDELKPVLLVVLGQTCCEAISLSTKAMLGAKDGEEGNAANDAVRGLSWSATAAVQQAIAELPVYCTADEIVARSVRNNVLNTMNFLWKHNRILQEKVSTNEVLLRGAIYVPTSGKVTFVDVDGREDEL